MNPIRDSQVLLPADIALYPELALIKVLDEVMGVAVLALVAAHPELDGDGMSQVGRKRSDEITLAWVASEQIYDLRRTLAQYRRTLEDAMYPPESDPGTDISF